MGSPSRGSEADSRLYSKLRLAFRSEARPAQIHAVELSRDERRLSVFSSSKDAVAPWLEGLLDGELIPPLVEHRASFGFEVDISAATGRAAKLSAAAGTECESRSEVTIQPGSKVEKSTDGTLGCLMAIEGMPHLLTAEHVVASPPGQPIYSSPSTTSYVVGTQKNINGGLGHPQTAIGDFELGKVCSGGETMVMAAPEPSCSEVTLSGGWVGFEDLEQLRGKRVVACTRDGARGGEIVATRAFVAARYRGLPGQANEVCACYENHVIIKGDTGWAGGHSGSLTTCVADVAPHAKKGDAIGVAYCLDRNFVVLTPFWLIAEYLAGMRASFSIMT